MAGQLRPACRHCLSFDVSLEVTAVYWDPGKRELEADTGNLTDKGHYCNTCDGETKLVWVDTLMVEVMEAEFDTILAALRYWQRMEMYNPDIASRRAPDEFSIATDRGEAINSEAIDKLIERLNS